MNQPNRFIGAWVSPKFFREIEKFIEKQGYSSKSEFLRNVLRKVLEEDA